MGFQKQFGRIQNAAAYRCGRIAPGRIEFTGLAATEAVLGKRIRHALTFIRIGARHRRQILHRDMRRDLAGAHALLHGFRQLLHQSQPPRYPTHAAIKAPGEIFQAVAETLLQFLEQPPLFQRRLLFGETHRPIQHQGVGFVHVPDDGLYRVTAQLFQSSDAFVSVDHQVSIPLIRNRHHHDWSLLSRRGQRRQQSPIAFPTSRTQMLIAAVQLMKFQPHGPLSCRATTLRQVRSGIAPSRREVCPQALLRQQHSPRTGIAWPAAGLGRKSQ